MPEIDLLARAKESDVVMVYLTQTITTAPIPVVLVGAHQESLSLRVLRTDPLGRLLVSQSTNIFDIVNTVLGDTAKQVFAGAPVFRRVTFYAVNANMLISFRRGDNVVTNEILAVPNVPLVIEGIFVAALARNAVAGVISTLNAVVNYDPQAGQI